MMSGIAMLVILRRLLVEENEVQLARRAAILKQETRGETAVPAHPAHGEPVATFD